MFANAVRALLATTVLSLSGLAFADAPPTPPRTISDLVLRTPDGGSVREIDVPGLPDTAMAELTGAGPVILYNPDLFRAAGPAREFVRNHEHAHVMLAHLEDPWMLDTERGRAEAEAEADCFAARRSSSLAVVAMARLVLRRAPDARDAIYGTREERARRILACAGISRG